MAHAHDVHAEGTGFATGFMLAIGALVLALVIAAVVLLVAQPWDDDDGGGVTDTVPGIEQPIGDGAGDTGGGDTGGGGADEPAQ